MKLSFCDFVLIMHYVTGINITSKSSPFNGMCFTFFCSTLPQTHRFIHKHKLNNIPLCFTAQPPSLMTRWSAAEVSVWPSRWPKTASTATATAPPQGSWRWTSSNCSGTANMRWGRQVSVLCVNVWGGGVFVCFSGCGL